MRPLVPGTGSLKGMCPPSWKPCASGLTTSTPLAARQPNDRSDRRKTLFTFTFFYNHFTSQVSERSDVPNFPNLSVSTVRSADQTLENSMQSRKREHQPVVHASTPKRRHFGEATSATSTKGTPTVSALTEEKEFIDKYVT